MTVQSVRSQSANGDSATPGWAGWSEKAIGRTLAYQLLKKKCVVIVPNCNWTGNECDLLAVTTDLRVIDIEIKISRADLKADAKKEKWWHYLSTHDAKQRTFQAGELYPCGKIKIEWPLRVWKHYYAIPQVIWKPELMDCMPSQKSGVVLLNQPGESRPAHIRCIRRASPNRDAARLSPESAIDVARLANLRMWEAFEKTPSKRPNQPSNFDLTSREKCSPW